MRKILFLFVIFSLMIAGSAFAEQRLMTYDTASAKYKADSELVVEADDVTISKNCTVTLKMHATGGFYVGAVEVIGSDGEVNINQIPNGEDLYIIGTDDIADISNLLSESGGIVYYKGIEIGTGSWDTEGNNTSTGTLNLGSDLTVQGSTYTDTIKSYSGGSSATAFSNTNGFTFAGDASFTGDATFIGDTELYGSLSMSEDLSVNDFYVANLTDINFDHDTTDGTISRNGVTQATIWSNGVKIANNLSIGANCALRDNGGGDFEYSENDGATWTDFGSASIDGAALDNVWSGNGILARTAAETYTNRTITGTSSEIEISDGDGVSGNPTIGLPDVVEIATSLTTGEVFSVEDIYFPLDFDTSVSGSNIVNIAFPVKDMQITQVRVLADSPISGDLTVTCFVGATEFTSGDKPFVDNDGIGTWVTGLSQIATEDDLFKVQLDSNSVAGDLSATGYLHIRGRGRDRI